MRVGCCVVEPPFLAGAEAVKKGAAPAAAHAPALTCVLRKGINYFWACKIN